MRARERERTRGRFAWWTHSSIGLRFAQRATHYLASNNTIRTCTHAHTILVHWMCVHRSCALRRAALEYTTIPWTCMRMQSECMQVERIVFTSASVNCNAFDRILQLRINFYKRQTFNQCCYYYLYVYVEEGSINFFSFFFFISSLSKILVFLFFPFLCVRKPPKRNGPKIGN